MGPPKAFIPIHVFEYNLQGRSEVSMFGTGTVKGKGLSNASLREGSASSWFPRSLLQRRLWLMPRLTGSTLFLRRRERIGACRGSLWL
jgi:hypothetical protein